MDDGAEGAQATATAAAHEKRPKLKRSTLRRLTAIPAHKIRQDHRHFPQMTPQSLKDLASEGAERPASATSSNADAPNAGDSRAVLCRRGEAERLTRDFKALDDDEYDRIVALGGYVSLRDGGRVNERRRLRRCEDEQLRSALIPTRPLDEARVDHRRE